MKNYYTLLSVHLAATLRLLGLVLVLGSVLPFASGQSVSLNEQFGDLSSREWKKNPDSGTVLAAELNNTDLALAQSDLQAADRAMYLAYKRIIQDVQGNKGATVDQSIALSYKQLLEDYLKDPVLKYLPLDGLAVLLQGLIESLSATQVAEIQRF
jgi:hypothetical protein